MLRSVYIETTIVSYLVARPSRDAIMAERQRQTREWWENRRGRFELFTSELVCREVARGEREMARARTAMLAGIPIFLVDPQVAALAAALLRKGPLPTRAETDAHHIALAAVHGLDYLVTWNCKHIANPRLYQKITNVCRERGFEPPVLCTPEELQGGG